MFGILRREAVYLWYYFSLQLEQIFGYWVLGMALGSAISVFAKDHIHGLFRSMGGKRLGVLGIFAASTLGIALPLCMYGTIPLAASFSESGMEDDWLAAFMMSSILLNPQLILYQADHCRPADAGPPVLRLFRGPGQRSASSGPWERKRCHRRRPGPTKWHCPVRGCVRRGVVCPGGELVPGERYHERCH